MAIIRSFEKPEYVVASRHPTEVDCGVQVVTTPLGEKLLTLSTFGSDSRRIQRKVSQTIQLDRDSASELIEILRGTFPGLN